MDGLGQSPELDRHLEATRQALAPPNSSLFVIGDIHGHAGLLRDLLVKIARDIAQEAPGQSCELIFLGDYIDRGPDARQVVDIVLAARADRRFGRVTALKGNHEVALLRFLEDAGYWPFWSPFGARSTLLAYGVEPPAIDSEADAWEDARIRLASSIPPAHLDFFRRLERAAVRGDYFCVHAGARPGVALGDQQDEDLFWIRDEFVRRDFSFEKVIVHGHTPCEPHLGANRIAIDSGAYFTGALTAVKLKGAERTLIQARREPASARREMLQVQEARPALAKPGGWAMKWLADASHFGARAAMISYERLTRGGPPR